MPSSERMRRIWPSSAASRPWRPGLQPDFLAVDHDRARVGHFEHVDAAQQGRLARAGRADQRDDFSGLGGKADAAQYLERPETLVDISDFDDGCHVFPGLHLTGG